jgi:UMF1 family MFS transporter
LWQFSARLFLRNWPTHQRKRAVLVSLIIWSGGGLWLRFSPTAMPGNGSDHWNRGGSKALRSLFSRMIPEGREASFFGLYEVSERGTSWLGPLIFGIVVAMTNSYRHALLSLIGLFLIGTVILYLTNTDRAIHEAGNLLPEEAARSH